MPVTTTSLAIGIIAAVLQALTLVRLLVFLWQSYRKSRSCAARWCRGCWAQCEKWLGKVSGTKKHIKAYRDIQRTILRGFCACFLVASSIQFIHVQVDVAANVDPVYLAVDIPLLVAHAMLLTVLLSPYQISPLALDFLHAAGQLLCAAVIYFSEEEDLQSLVHMVLLPRLVTALWAQHGWKALVGHCLCSGVLWWRDPDMMYAAFETLGSQMILTCILHRHISFLAQQQINLSTKRVSMDAAAALMSGVCDCVVEVDSSFKLLEESPQLGTMLFCENSAATMAGADFLDCVVTAERPGVESFLQCDGGSNPTMIARLIDSAGTQIKVELLQLTFFTGSGASCRLVGIRESPDFTGSTISPLKSDGAISSAGGKGVPDCSIAFDAVTFDILVASDEFENLFARCTGHFADFEHMSIYDLSPDVGETSLSRRIQGAVNSFNHTKALPRDARLMLGSFNFLGVCTVKAVLNLEHDPALGTLVGTLRCMEHREKPAGRVRAKRQSLARKSLQGAPPTPPPERSNKKTLTYL